jgi:HK97 family phage major capsid protein
VPRSASSATTARKVSSGFSAIRANSHSRPRFSRSCRHPPICLAAALPVARQRCDHFTTLATLTPNSDGGDPDARLVRAATGASEVDPTGGGFLVRQEFASELIGSLYENAVIAALCTRERTDFPGRERNLPAVDETSRSDGLRWGGVLAYWLAEGTSVTTKFPRFRRVTMNTEKLIAVSYATNELLDDVPLLSAHRKRALASELAFKLDLAILIGAGAALGITNTTATIQVAKESGQAGGTIFMENVDKMWSRLPLPCRRRAVWLCNEDAEAQLDKMVLVIGASGAAPRIYQPAGAFGNEFPTLYGRPLIAVEQAPALGTVGDIVLADLSQYSILEGPPQMALSDRGGFSDR